LLCEGGHQFSVARADGGQRFDKTVLLDEVPTPVVGPLCLALGSVTLLGRLSRPSWNFVTAVPV
jgi:hypothetical protein